MAQPGPMSLKNQLGGFDIGLGADLRQQLLDEEDARTAQLKLAKLKEMQQGPSNIATMDLLGAGGSLKF